MSANQQDLSTAVVREAEKANNPFLAALPGALRRCSSLVWLATRRSERLALHPASAPKNGILTISTSLTGGSRGIGRAVSIALARQGWNVCFSYESNKKAADETLSGIHAVGRRALAVQADLANRDDISRLFESAHKAFGRLDALVNKCRNCRRAVFDSGRGRRPPDGGFPHQCDRQFLLRQRGGLGGSVVNMSSAAARHGGMPNEAHYAASKGAIDSFTLSLAKELAPHGIRVNAVRPGLIATEVHEVHGGQALLDKIGPTVPIGRAGTADEGAQVVAFLAGPLSRYMPGALVDVSGGR